MSLRGRYWYWRRWWRRHGLLIHRAGTCRLCGRPVQWSTRRARRTAKGRLYCGQVCRGVVDEAAHEPRKKSAETWGVRQGLAPITDLEPKRLPPRARPCPHPWKLRFDSEDVATRAFAEVLLRDRSLEVYQCRCLAWHAGHRPDHLRGPVFEPFDLAGVEPYVAAAREDAATIADLTDPAIVDRLRRMFDA